MQPCKLCRVMPISLNVYSLLIMVYARLPGLNLHETLLEVKNPYTVIVALIRMLLVWAISV